jgi:hypothetical protein
MQPGIDEEGYGHDGGGEEGERSESLFHGTYDIIEICHF